jgi:hypothetical protein
MYRQHNVLGMDIREVGRRTMKGMEEGIVICIPYEDREEIIKNETQRMIHYCTPEGMVRLEEETKKGKLHSSGTQEEVDRMNAAVSVGWGKAKDDIDWIDPSKKHS